MKLLGMAAILLCTSATAGTVHYPDQPPCTNIESGYTLEGEQLPTYFEAPTLAGDVLTFTNIQYGVIGPPLPPFLRDNATITFDTDAHPWRITFGGGAFIETGSGLARMTIDGINYDVTPTIGPWEGTAIVPAASHIAVLFHIEVSDELSSLNVSHVAFAPLVLNPSGDYNGDGTVNAADYTVWRNVGGSRAEYDNWKTHYGESVPTPVPSPDLLFAVIAFVMGGRRR